MRPLRNVLARLPDLSLGFRRARQPARAHLSGQGAARRRARRRLAAPRQLPHLPRLRNRLPGRSGLRNHRRRRTRNGRADAPARAKNRPPRAGGVFYGALAAGRRRALRRRFAPAVAFGARSFCPDRAPASIRPRRAKAKAASAAHHRFARLRAGYFGIRNQRRAGANRRRGGDWNRRASRRRLLRRAAVAFGALRARRENHARRRRRVGGAFARRPSRICRRRFQRLRGERARFRRALAGQRRRRLGGAQHTFGYRFCRARVGRYRAPNRAAVDRRRTKSSRVSRALHFAKRAQKRRSGGGDFAPRGDSRSCRSPIRICVAARPGRIRFCARARRAVCAKTKCALCARPRRLLLLRPTSAVCCICAPNRRRRSRIGCNCWRRNCDRNRREGGRR